jgi:hypothetical protein
VPQAPESEAPDVKITGADVWAVLEAAKGRCEHCRSLAVESRPSGPNGKPLPWTQAGRRIGSLVHRQARFNGHSSPRAAMIYQHATRERDKSIAAALGKFLDATRDGAK